MVTSLVAVQTKSSGPLPPAVQTVGISTWPVAPLLKVVSIKHIHNTPRLHCNLLAAFWLPVDNKSELFLVALQDTGAVVGVTAVDLVVALDLLAVRANKLERSGLDNVLDLSLATRSVLADGEVLDLDLLGLTVGDRESSEESSDKGEGVHLERWGWAGYY